MNLSEAHLNHRSCLSSVTHANPFHHPTSCNERHVLCRCPETLDVNWLVAKSGTKHLFSYRINVFVHGPTNETKQNACVFFFLTCKMFPSSHIQVTDTD